MNYTIQDILRIIKAEPLLVEAAKNPVKDLLIDSRSLNNASVSLFFAIKGKRHDGHTYIPELFEKGVRNFVVSEEPENIAEYKGCNFLKVADTLKALQTLAAAHRAAFVLPVIGHYW